MRGVKLAEGFLDDGLESHVLFAPCNSNEVGSRQTDAAPLPRLIGHGLHRQNLLH